MKKLLHTDGSFGYLLNSRYHRIGMPSYGHIFKSREDQHWEFNGNSHRINGHHGLNLIIYKNMRYRVDKSERRKAFALYGKEIRLNINKLVI